MRITWIHVFFPLFLLPWFGAIFIHLLGCCLTTHQPLVIPEHNIVPPAAPPWFVLCYCLLNSHKMKAPPPWNPKDLHVVLHNMGNSLTAAWSGEREREKRRDRQWRNTELESASVGKSIIGISGMRPTEIFTHIYKERRRRRGKSQFLLCSCRGSSLLWILVYYSPLLLLRVFFFNVRHDAMWLRWRHKWLAAARVVVTVTLQ